jgi:arginase family enzyme
MRNFVADKVLRFDDPVYVSIDLDVLDPAFAPGVSHHEPGGMSSRQLIEFLHKLEAPIVGADIVEYNPRRDPSEITAMLAVKLLKEIVALMLKQTKHNHP